jgi:hypothetical protein
MEKWSAVLMANVEAGGVVSGLPISELMQLSFKTQLIAGADKDVNIPHRPPMALGIPLLRDTRPFEQCDVTTDICSATEHFIQAVECLGRQHIRRKIRRLYAIGPVWGYEARVAF